MTWNWQKKQWPQFTHDAKKLELYEREYATMMGIMFGVMQHVEEEERNTVIVDILSTEGIKTAEIEGEILHRDSVQSSIRKKLGLTYSKKKVQLKEAGMAEMLVSVYKNYACPLTEEELHNWHTAMMQGRTDIETIGAYRTHEEPMQIVSNRFGGETVYFEAPPSKRITKEMREYIQWFNDANKSLPPLIHAGIAHLFAVCIHPYEDGNGRMARALVEKSLSQSMNTPALSGFSRQILKKKSEYYKALEDNNKELDITNWLLYFAETIIDAKKYNIQLVESIIRKAHLLRQWSTTLNDRQKKIIHRLFEAEPEGFIGGISAKKYMLITHTSSATTTRDLQELVEMNILQKTGDKRYARYWLQKNTPLPRATL